MNLTTDHWHYLHQAPESTGIIKQRLEDFQVTEILGYEPCGEGEHVYLWVRKVELNTAFVAEALAKFAGVPLRSVTFAGRKDKYAVTEQWFSVHIPGKNMPDWSQFVLDGATILSFKRHNKKLRTGVLRGNRFIITVRDLKAAVDLEASLKQIQEKGVPNYFGEQRFGNKNSNLYLANLMLGGETIRNRNKRSMAISALRSWLFNEVVSQRIANELFNKVLEGDAMQLAGSNSFFIQTADATDTESRMSEGDVSITAPLWGSGNLATKADAAEFEVQAVAPFQVITEGLVDLKLKQERRSLHLQPQNMQWQIDDDALVLSFELPSGCFATSVLREIIKQPDGGCDEAITQ